MRRRKAFKRGRLILIAFAGGIGYLLGGWHAATPRSSNTDLSPAQSVALRFPERTDAPVTLPAPRETARSAVDSAGIMTLGDPQLLLLSPDPMIPQSPKAPEPSQVSAAAAPVAAVAPPQLPQPPAPRPAPATARRSSQEAPPATALASRQANRPGFVLNEGQIASIKERLHLTPGQQSKPRCAISPMRDRAPDTGAAQLRCKSPPSIRRASKCKASRPQPFRCS
jgi:hypothetical protein